MERARRNGAARCDSSIRPARRRTDESMRELARRTGQVGRLAAPEEPDLDVAIALSTSKKVSASWMGPEPATRRNRETEGRCKEHRSDRGQREFGVCAEASVLDHPESGQNGRRRSCLASPPSTYFIVPFCPPRTASPCSARRVVIQARISQRAWGDRPDS